MDHRKISANISYDPRFINIPELKDTVASRIQYARIKRQLTTKRFAELSKTTYEYVWVLERGKRETCPAFPLLKRMAHVLKVSPIWLGCFDLMPETTLAEKLRKARFYHLKTLKEASEFFHVCSHTFIAWEKNRTAIHEEHLDEWLSVLCTPIEPHWE